MKLRISLVVLSLILSTLIGFSFSQRLDSQADGAEKDRLLIGLSMDTLKEARWQRDRDLLVARAESLGASVLVQSANSDDTRQIQDIQALLSSKVDVLVIVPHNGKAMAKAVKMAHEADTPVIALLVYVVTQHTPFGRYLYAIGDNEEAAALSGIPIQKVVIGAYALLGGVVALTGFMQTAYAGASTTTVGDLMELDAIAACVIEGTSLKDLAA